MVVILSIGMSSLHVWTERYVHDEETCANDRITTQGEPVFEEISTDHSGARLFAVARACVCCTLECPRTLVYVFSYITPLTRTETETVTNGVREKAPVSHSRSVSEFWVAQEKDSVILRSMLYRNLIIVYVGARLGEPCLYSAE